MEPDSPETFYVARMAPPTGVVVAVAVSVAVVLWSADVISFLTGALWGAPEWVVWLLLLSGIGGLVVFSTERTLFIVRPTSRMVTFRRHVLWFLPVTERSARFDEIRHIDLHHTGEHSTAGLPRLTEWLSPEHLPWGHRLYFNGLSPSAWLVDWLLCGLPYSGSAEIRIMLNDRTEWKIMSARSEEHVAAIGGELKRITGARLT